MKYFPDQPADSVWARCAVAVLPLVYLVVALIYSANSAPWGRTVDPESAYMMNGIAWTAGYGMILSSHPGTTTIVLGGLVARIGALLNGQPDVVEFALRHYDALIYASRAIQIFLMFGALLGGGIIVRRTTQSAFAAAFFQVAPFVHFEALRLGTMLAPESLMVTSAVFGLALVLKAALDRKAADGRPRRGAGRDLCARPLVQIPLCAAGGPQRGAVAQLARLCRGDRLSAHWRSLSSTGFSTPTSSEGFHWLAGLATHKGIYGHGEPGFIDFSTFWPNMAEIITSGPMIFAAFLAGACLALLRMWRSRNYLDPVSLTLLAMFAAYGAQLVATSKHFHLYYMLASWVLTGGVLVLAVVEARRLWPARSPRLTSGIAGLACVLMVATTLIDARREAVAWIAANQVGARLSKAIVSAGPTCANVSRMFVRAPENLLNFGADNDAQHPEDGGPFLRSLSAHPQDAAAGSQFLPQCAAQEFPHHELPETRGRISVHRGANRARVRRQDVDRAI